MPEHPIVITEARESDREFCSEVNKAAYFDLISRLWGWDEERHRNIQDERWQEQPPGIIRYDNTPIGTVRIRRDAEVIEISQFCIFPEYQNRGIGARVLRMILDEADTSGVRARLAVLYGNQAKSLYERHGFRKVSTEEDFFWMEREPELSVEKEPGR